MNPSFYSCIDSIGDEADRHLAASINEYKNRHSMAPRHFSTTTTTQKDKGLKQVGGKPKQTDSSSMVPKFLNAPFFANGFSIVPPIDVLDRESNYEIHVSIPGVSKDQINLDFDPEKNEFKISGEIPGHVSEHADKLRVQERSSGRFERTVSFPITTKLDEENIRATFENGVLVLTVPKLQKTQSTHRRIMISSSEPSASDTEEAAGKGDSKS